MMPLMPPRVRKSLLTVHVLSSVGWVGAVAAFLVLAVAGYSTSDNQLAAGIYVSLSLMVWWLIIPLSVVSWWAVSSRPLAPRGDCCATTGWW